MFRSICNNNNISSMKDPAVSFFDNGTEIKADVPGEVAPFSDLCFSS